MYISLLSLSLSVHLSLPSYNAYARTPRKTLFAVFKNALRSNGCPSIVESVTPWMCLPCHYLAMVICVTVLALQRNLLLTCWGWKSMIHIYRSSVLKMEGAVSCQLIQRCNREYIRLSSGPVDSGFSSDSARPAVRIFCVTKTTL
jgi:hypothetical protein